MPKKTTLLAGALAAIFLLFIQRGHSSPLAAAGSESPPAGGLQTLQSLLGEVRELRLALQRTSLSAYRNQVLIERVRLQGERVDGVRQRLEQVQEEGANAGSNAQRMRERLKSLEGQLDEERDPGARAQFRSEYEGLKAMLEEEGQQESLRRQKEARLAEQLQAEQAKATALDERLEAVEREMEKELGENPRQEQK